MMKEQQQDTLPHKEHKRAKVKVAAAMAFVIASLLLLSFGFLAYANHGPAGSHLVDVGPVHPVNGFPMWYKDSNNLHLELCTDPNLCFFFPPDPASPISFPGNFADEAFYWAAEALMVDATPPNPNKANGTLGRAIITLALEGAFANGPVVDGDQVVFGRIRIRVDNLVQGETYTVTHPYGVDVFPNIGADAGPGAIAGPGISYVEDIGIGAPGDFTGALDSRIGPFLIWDPATAPPPPPGFIADGGLTLQKVIGSPYGTNFFRVEGRNVGDPSSAYLCADPALGPDPVAVTDCIETDLFSVMGKLATNFGAEISRATYSRTSAGPGAINVYARSVEGITQTIEISAPAVGPVTMRGDGLSMYFAQAPYPQGSLPTVITATNVSDNPNTVVSSALVDMVNITRAEYDRDLDILTVTAASSDQAITPTLTLVGHGPLVSGLITTTGFTIPPRNVTVVSSAGGSDTEQVVVVSSLSNISPIVGDDLATINEDTSITLDLLANDSDPDGIIIPSSLTIVTPQTNGALVNHGDGTVTYTPNPNYAGGDSFQYTVNDNGGATSSRATVSIRIAGVNDAPIAVDDVASTNTFDLLANDTDIDGTLVPSSLTILTQPADGTLVNNGDGTVTYTPGLNFTGNDSFTYQVSDNDGAVSNIATVTITTSIIGGNFGPVLNIVSPADGSTYQQGWPINLTATANDFEDGDLSANVVWTSDLDGQVGTGAYTLHTLSVGTHQITAVVTDTSGFSDSATISITIIGGSSPVAFGPVHPVHGFPTWYQDSLGTSLELCLDALDPLCGFVPGDVPNPALPVQFPNNFPAEAFWWMADTLMPLPGGGDASLTLGLDAGFANGTIINGDQAAFARTRLSIAGLTPGGVYTIIHPYGTLLLMADVNGTINYTQDIGVDFPGVFSTALNAFPGPFLTWDPITDAPAGYLGDPNVDHAIIGSPYGTNFFRIEGANIGGPGIDFVQTDLFTLMGKLMTAATGPGNTPPAATITAPADGSSAVIGSTITFSGIVTDTEEGDLSARLIWTSDLNGEIGRGASVSTSSLFAGTHTITAYVADSGGLTDVQSITVSILSPDSQPVVTVTAPAAGASAEAGAQMSFTGLAIDQEDGNVSASLVWTSDVDGQIGTGASISTSSLSLGNHVITATATDSSGLTGSASIAVTIVADTIHISRAQYRPSGSQWRITGTGSVPGNTITLYVGSTVGGTVLTTNVTVGANGNWKVGLRFAPPPDSTNTISALSSGGGVHEAVRIGIR
ncbi:MAG: tandem-95 repeat protein [Anaerolineae bacterium]